MPFRNIPDMDVSYALISFDNDGRERSDDPEGGVFSRVVLERAKQAQPSHVFIFAHGWKGDVPSAIEQYNAWIGAMCKLEADRAAMGADFRPMFIGLHWPSQPWGDEGLANVAAAPVNFDPSAAAAMAPAPDVEALFEKAARQFGGKPEVRAPLRVIFDAYAANPNGFVVPEGALAAYRELASAVGFSAGAGPEAPPDSEGAALDPQQAVNANRVIEAGSNLGVFDKIRQGILGGLGQISFWSMKNLGMKIGEGGMHAFVADLMHAVPARIHVMGHSFGCVVASSILGGPAGKGRLPRPVNSVVLVQGAVSLWAWGDKVKNLDKPGYFRGNLSNGSISGPVVTTRSVNDRAVGLAYPAAVALVGQAAFVPTPDLPLFGGTGSFGLQGTAVGESSQMLASTAAYRFQPGKIYNLECSPFIPSHNGIDGPEVAHMIWQAAL